MKPYKILLCDHLNVCTWWYLVIVYCLKNEQECIIRF